MLQYKVSKITIWKYWHDNNNLVTSSLLFPMAHFKTSPQPNNLLHISAIIHTHLSSQLMYYITDWYPAVLPPYTIAVEFKIDSHT